MDLRVIVSVLESGTELKNLSEDTIQQNDNLSQQEDAGFKATQNQIDTTNPKTDSIKKYSGSSLTSIQKVDLLLKLSKLMQEEKIFINHKLSIEDVAYKLESNTKYISQIINETYNKNFYNFINYHRIEEAKKLLVMAENEKYSILGMAQSVGFVSKSTFNVAFKRFTGLTPTEYKNKTASKT